MTRAGGARPRAARPGRRPRRRRHDPLRAGRRPRRPRVGGRRRASARVLDGLLGGVELRRFPHGLDTPIAPLSGGERRRIALGHDAARRARAAAARRADEPPRRRGRRLARAPPRRPPRLAAGRHPRPLVPRRGLHGDVGGRRRRRAPLRGRLRGVRAGPRRARPAGRRARGAPPAAAAQGARLAAARAAGAHVQAEVPDRGRQRADRRRARRRATAPSCCASPPRGWATRCSTPRTSRSRTAARRVLRDVTWRLGPGRPRRARRRQRLGQDDAAALLAGELRAGRRRGRARRDRAPRPPLPGHRRDPRPPARARVARGGPRRARRSATARRSPRRCCATASASAATARARWSATSPAASGAGCSSCGC